MAMGKFKLNQESHFSSLANALVDAQPAGTSQQFAVKFFTGHRHAGVPNSFSFYGKGEIIVGHDGVTISGKTHRLFRTGLPAQQVFPASEILNVHAIGPYVKFQAQDKESQVPHEIGFDAGSAEAAREIAARLPRHQTDQFVQDTIEQNDFLRRLDKLSPSAPVTPALVALNLIVFVLMLINGYGLIDVKPEMAVQWGSNYGPLTMQGQWWRLLTSTFIHFGLIHIAFNMYALYATGRTAERMYGSLHFLILYLFAGLTGSLVSTFWHPAQNSAGASGAIFGVFGGLLAFMLNKKNAVPVSIMNAHAKSTGLFIAYNLMIGFSHSGIDNGAHLGGLAGGFVMGYLLARPLEISARAKLLTVRFALACVTGLTILALLGFVVMHSNESARKDNNFVAALTQFEEGERAVLADFERARLSVVNKQTSELEFADYLDKKIAPEWSGLRSTIGVPTLDVDSKFFALQSALVKFVDDRSTVYSLMSKGLRDHDNGTIQQFKDANDQVKRELDSIKVLQSELSNK